ncbi:MAG: preprotein translocase subunit SecA [Chloroflexi bacterium]|nr:preprotein translocase subunit SecA [Chloroflexota bacterium]
MVSIFRKILGGGDSNDRVVKDMGPLIASINSLEPEMQALDSAALAAKTGEFRARLAAGETLDDLLPEAFAVAREAIHRTMGQRPYDVQMIGAITLHRGEIAEMKTGEGKTLVSIIAIYLNALDGEGIHAVTVNDYLARRDAQWYTPALDLLGITVGVIQNQGAYVYSRDVVSEQSTFEHLIPVNRAEAYATDVTYGTNNEFGFDYLRDNMATTLGNRVQRSRHFAVVDEADSILIDEARTPLIISGPAQDDTSLYPRFAKIVPMLQEGVHYNVELRHRAVNLTEAGVEMLEKALGIANIYSLENFRLTRYMEAALKAQVLYQRDHDYVVKDGEVIIVDAFTGRLMEGRRWSDGLHQAVEAKEGVKIQQETVTYATITIQNYFRLYDKLAGMTGTAVTEAEELDKIYKLDVTVIPPNRPVVRDDMPDLVYRTLGGKWQAVVEDIVGRNAEGRPVLVGTVAIETSEMLSGMLKRRSIDHEVLNAKQHQREAQIVARAGERGAVTIATNMAGRGTDIKLGEGVAERGGLHVIGTERHESRRIDNQLRGRAGRQGDPGSTRFYVSFEDEIMKRFAPEWLPGLMARMGMDDETPLESKMVTKAIEQAQQRVESYNFDTRKHVVEYDDVMNTHRDVVYNERDKVLRGESMRDTVMDMLEQEVEELASIYLGPDPDPEAFRAGIDALADLQPDELPVESITNAADATDAALEIVDARYLALEESVGEETQRLVERLVILRTIDTLWVEHLTAVEEMRQGIGLRAYGQSDPLVAYKREALDMWDQFRERIRQHVARQILHARIAPQAAAEAMAQERAPQHVQQSGPGDPDGAGDAPTTVTATRVTAKVGRNDPCPCGSGKKYKRCHGM